MYLSIFVYVTNVYQIDVQYYYCQERKLYFVPDSYYICDLHGNLTSEYRNMVNIFNEETYNNFIENMLKIYDIKGTSPPFYFYVDMEMSEEELFYYTLQIDHE